ncbi:MAG TPA: G1 family glutamic endopeptidase [Streptosporangiaceae bacterium]
MAGSAAASAATAGAAHGATASLLFPPATPGSTLRTGHGTRPDIDFTNWAGYAVTDGTLTSISANWVAPTVKCFSAKTYSGFWVGFGGTEGPPIEQTGIAGNCSGGTATYYSWYEMYPSPVHKYPSTVMPGDDMSASVIYDGSNTYTLTIADSTQGWKHTVRKTESISGGTSSAEVIAEAPCCTSAGNPRALANFGTINFSDAKVNKSAIGTLSPTEITMVNNGVVKATPSALSGNKNFSITFGKQG